ncbi:Potassium transporter [Dillenia turbinata]|uniref:Potassium transporter n=1 Tax=Dillenia turbinata TaxID=194707 RepID=A0AAN8V372_9MAGN
MRMGERAEMSKVLQLEEQDVVEVELEKRLEERKISWAELKRVDSLHLEAGRVSYATASHSSKVNWSTTLSLAFQSIGVVYGDIGTSPLYVFASTFPGGIRDTNDILGVLSLIIYTLALVPMLKYVFIVLWANDNGDGEYAKVSLIPNHQPEDRELSNYKLDTPSSQLRRAQKIKEKLENCHNAPVALFLVTILGTSMVIGDGVLTPCISGMCLVTDHDSILPPRRSKATSNIGVAINSDFNIRINSDHIPVLSAVSGISSLNQDEIVWISIGILVVLFCFQRFGTDKVGYSFAPIICVWFTFIGGIGLYNLFKYEIGVLRAFNPKYIIDYFKRNGKQGWISLGGVVLCITGTEAMFADLGHFNIRAIQISFSGIVFPALLAAYSGQAAYLRKHPDHVLHTFYDCIPSPLYWPTFVVAVAAAIIASQAMISGAFSIISQSLSLGCFPRVKVVHTSAKFEGQVYIPEINYILMMACVVVTAAFKTTEKIGNAYGIAVVAVMTITTCMVTLIMLVIWKTSIWWIATFFLVFISIEGLYLSSVLYKFIQGGYLPLAFSLVLMIIMGIWHYVHKQRYLFELRNKVSGDFLRQLAMNPDINRIPGMGLLYSELVQGIPPIFPHFLASIPSIHSVLVFVSIKSLPISKVALQERFLFRQVEPKEYRMFRCVVRYGYNDTIEEPKEFERHLVQSLKDFIRHEQYLEGAPTGGGGSGTLIEGISDAVAGNPQISTLLTRDHGKPRGAQSGGSSTVHIEESLTQLANAPTSSASIQSSFNMANKSNNSSNRITSGPIQGAQEEMQFVQKAMEKGVVYLLGEAEVVAQHNSSLLKKIVVNNIYGFLRRNVRQGENVMAIPRSRLLRVGMTYEI